MPRPLVLGGVAVAGLVSWVGAGLVAWNAWHVAFTGGHGRVEAAVSTYLVLALLASALAALPFTFLQWVDPDRTQRWQSVGGAVGVSGCALFLLLWLLG
ncbi:MAG TPA: hypothetical protein VFK68_01295 [Propionibacteriaceae bacterium]|nr:hypothetical protein [Propionibacteriaceae bacterium]